MEQSEIVDSFVEIARRHPTFPIPAMVTAVSVFAEKLNLAPAELGLIIRARDIEIHGSPLPYTGEEEGE